jgi:hypothetical protein
MHRLQNASSKSVGILRRVVVAQDVKHSLGGVWAPKLVRVAVIVIDKLQDDVMRPEPSMLTVLDLIDKAPPPNK